MTRFWTRLFCSLALHPLREFLNALRVKKINHGETAMKLAKAFCLLPIAFCFLFTNEASSQVYPVQGSAALIPPYALRLSDYQTSINERFVLNAFLADISKPELHVRFRIRIEGQNVKLETKPEYIGSMVTMTGGAPLRMSNIELAEYFDPNHLNFSGISKNDFLKTGFLPEGFYQFCFEVLEYNRGVKISNTICAPAWLIMNDPPIVNLPRNGDKLKPLNPQNVIFQWTPRHTGSPNAAFSTEYDVKVVEVWPANRNPNDAILTQPAIYETTTNSTTLIYGPEATQLEPGRTYAFRVQARAIAGADHFDLFKNNGYSETVTFIYGDACDAPINIVAEASTPSRISLQWDAAPSQTGYTVQYRVKGQTDGHWYSNSSLIASTEIGGLQPNTTYEYQVMSTCGFFESSFGNLATITTPDMSQKGYSCGVAIENFNLDPSQLIPVLKVGEVINAGDFDVTITKITGGSGTFSGEGVVVVPFLNQVRATTKFDNITVNNDKRMVKGFMNITGGGVEVVPSSVVNAMDQLSQGLSQAISVADSLNKALFPDPPDPATFVATQEIKVPAGIKEIYKDPISGAVIIVDNNGQSQTIPSGANVAVTDSKGKGALVNSSGGIANTTSAIAHAAVKRELNLGLTFAKAANSQNGYGFDEKKFDQLKDNYEKLGDSYFVSWKAVAANNGDPVVATYSNKDVDLSKIKFEQAFVPLTATVSGGTMNLTVNAIAAETTASVVAKIVPADTAKKEQILGKLNVIGYDSKSFNLHIVPVNGMKINADKEAIKKQLNDIYAQAVVDWIVDIGDNFQVSGLSSPFDNGSSGLLSNYTGDMRTVINAYSINTPLKEGDYYLFLVPKGTKQDEDGYMPRGKQCGFLFVDGTEVATTVIRTMAHELGHGAFTLKHSFDQYKSLVKKSTDNLMDYNDEGKGTLLWKKQWDQIHDPVTVLGLFESDAASASSADATFDEPIAQADGGWIAKSSISCSDTRFLMPFNTVVKIPDSYYSKITEFRVVNNRLDGFKIDGKIYLATRVVVSENDKYLGNKPSYYFTCWEDVQKNMSPSKMKDSDGVEHTVYTGVLGSAYVRTVDKQDCTGKVVGSEGNCHTIVDSDCIENTSTIATNSNGSAKGTVVNYSKQSFTNTEIEKLLNGEKKYSDPLAGELRAIKVKIFLTDAQTSDADRKLVENYVPPVGEAFAWLHFDGKTWQMKSGLSKSAQSLSDAFTSNGLPGLSFNDFLTGIQEFYKQNPLDNTLIAVYSFFDATEKFIAKAKIPESIWNCDLTNPKDPYDPIYAKVYGFIVFPLASVYNEGLRAVTTNFNSSYPDETAFIGSINKVYDKTNQIQFAFLCGIWDGIIDIPGGLAAILKTVTGAVNSKGVADFQKFYNQLNSYKREDPENTVVASGWWACLKDGMADQFSIQKPCQLAHNIAPVVVGVVITYFSAGAGSEVLVESVTGRFVLQVLNIFSKIDLITEKFSLGAKLVGKVGGAALHLTVKFGGGAFKYVIDNGRIVFRVTRRLEEAFVDLDWSLVKTADVLGLDGNTYTVMIPVDPTDNFNIVGKRIKKIVADEKGNLIKDESGNMLAKLDDADETPVIVKGGKDFSNLFTKSPDLKILFDGLPPSVKANFSSLTEGTLEDILTKLKNNSSLLEAINNTPDIAKLWTKHKNDFSASELEDAYNNYAEAATDFSDDLRKQIDDLADESGAKQQMLERFERGNDFGDLIKIQLAEASSDAYVALKKELALANRNLDNYTIYSQVQLCLKGDCLSKGNYWIPDFVAVIEKYDEVLNKNYLETIIIDSKLSKNTDWTKNQSVAKSMDGWSIKTTPGSPVKGKSIDSFKKDAFVKKDGAFIKIFSDAGLIKSYR